MQKGFWHLLQFRTCLEVLAQTCLTRSFGSDLQALDPPYLLPKRLCLLMSFCFGFCLPTALATLDRYIESPALATEVTDPGKACLLQHPSTLAHCVDDALISTHNNGSGQDVIPRPRSTARLIRFLDSLPYSMRQGSPATAQTSSHPCNSEDLLI